MERSIVVTSHFLLPLAGLLHVLLAVIWVGGMLFAHQVLRPAAGGILESPQRLRLWRRVLRKFFIWVWHAVVLMPITGYWMAYMLFGGMGQLPAHVNVMQGLGWIMIALFLYVFFGPYRRLGAAVDAEDWARAADALAGVRKVVGVNLVIGIVVVVVASGGRLSGGLF